MRLTKLQQKGIKDIVTELFNACTRASEYNESGVYDIHDSGLIPIELTKAENAYLLKQLENIGIIYDKDDDKISFIGAKR